MNPNVRRILDDVGAPRDPAPVDLSRLEQQLVFSSEYWFRPAEEFGRWAGLQCTRFEAIPRDAIFRLVLGHGEPAARAVFREWKEHLLALDDLDAVAVNKKLDVIRAVAVEAKKLLLTDWDLRDIPRVTTADTADVLRRRWSVSIPAELDQEVRRAVGPPAETISSFVETACRRELERRERDRSDLRAVSS